MRDSCNLLYFGQWCRKLDYGTRVAPGAPRRRGARGVEWRRRITPARRGGRVAPPATSRGRRRGAPLPLRRPERHRVEWSRRITPSRAARPAPSGKAPPHYTFTAPETRAEWNGAAGLHLHTPRGPPQVGKPPPHYTFTAPETRAEWNGPAGLHFCARRRAIDATGTPRRTLHGRAPGAPRRTRQTRQPPQTRRAASSPVTPHRSARTQARTRS